MAISTVSFQVPGAMMLEVTEDALTAELCDGRTISVPLAWYPRLVHATPEERNNWEIHVGRTTPSLARSGMKTSASKCC